MVHLILLVLACICFGARALGVPSKVDLVALGLLFFALRELF